MKIMLFSLQIFLDFQKNSLVKLTKLKNSKKNKKSLKKLLTNNNIYYIINT